MFQDQRVGDDEHQRDRQLTRLEQGVARVRVKKRRDQRDRLLDKAEVALPLAFVEWPHIAVDKVRDKERIDRRNGGRLCRGEDAAVDAAQE